MLHTKSVEISLFVSRFFEGFLPCMDVANILVMFLIWLNVWFRYHHTSFCRHRITFCWRLAVDQVQGDLSREFKFPYSYEACIKDWQMINIKPKALVSLNTHFINTKLFFP